MALVGDDCYYFLNSGCVRGSQCSFRHQPGAKATSIVCPQWLQRNCFEANCTLRHINTNGERAPNPHTQTPCYFETTMGACYKPHCPFTHSNPNKGTSLPPTVPPAVLPGIPPTLRGLPPPLGPLPNTVRPIAVEATRAPRPIVGLQVQPTPKVGEMLIANRPPVVASMAKTGLVATPPTIPQPAAKEAAKVPAVGAAHVNMFPKNEHFNEQVRRFKEMLATKKLTEDKDERKKEERPKERQRDKRDKEKEGHSVHRGGKSSKESWSRAEEEMLYGDYKDIPLHKKSKKKKKRKSHKEYPDSDSEVQAKTHEEVLREKALEKLYSNRNKKEKDQFAEDFNELLSEEKETIDVLDDEQLELVHLRDDKPKSKSMHTKASRPGKKYNSDGDEADSSDEDSEGNFKRRKAKNRRASEEKQGGEGRRHRRARDSENASRRSDIKDVEANKAINESEKRRKVEDARTSEDIEDDVLRNAILDSQRRNKLKEAEKEVRSSKKKKERRRKRGDAECELIEVQPSGGSGKEGNGKDEKTSSRSSPETHLVEESNDSDSDANEIVISDETTSVVDVSVDIDDDLAMEINESEKNKGTTKTKTKKISSVVSVINKTPSTVSVKPARKGKERQVNEVVPVRHRISGASNDLRVGEEKGNEKKVVRLVKEKTNEVLKPLGRESPSNLNAAAAPKTVKVKSFEEIMAEKQKRKDLKGVDCEVIDPLPLSDSLSLQKKSMETKLEILDVDAKDRTASTSKGNIVGEEEKQKRKSVQLYKPPHPAKLESEEAKNTEMKTAVNAGPRKIIRIGGKAALSTDYIDDALSEATTSVEPVVEEEKRAVTVRSFEEIIREKRARQKKEREVAKQQMEKENDKNTSGAATNSPPTNTLRRKPVLRRHTTTTTTQVSNPFLTTSTPASAIVEPVCVGSTAVTTTCSNSNVVLNVHTNNTVSPLTNETKRPLDANVAKVSPLVKVLPQKRCHAELADGGATGSGVEGVTNKHSSSRLTRRTSTHTTSDVAECVSDEAATPMKLRRQRSVNASTTTPTPTLATKTTTHATPPSLVSPVDTSHSMPETCGEEDVPCDDATSRQDIQDALDEEKRRREEDIMSDDEFQKEIDELGLDEDEDEDDGDDMNEDDILMELEQMIGS